MDDRKRMRELIGTLNHAAKVYYQGEDEEMSNYEYDALYDELESLEKKTGTVLANSPTMRVGYEVLSELPKEAHSQSVLSLDKTKSAEALADWLGERKGVLSWKLDGLTVIVTYEAGLLAKAVTRGNGVVGEVITNNAKVFANIPLQIPYKGQLVIRGEAIITYSDFERINQEIEEDGEKYKNPRNLCSGSVRQLNNEVTAKRSVRYLAYEIVGMEGEGTDAPPPMNSRLERLGWLRGQGFEVVAHQAVDRDNVVAAVGGFEKEIATNDFPSDGLVLNMDDVAYGKSLGQTSKYPRDAIAFKWVDETKETVLREIEWSASRTGLINPVAIFDPVELEGTTVSRASVHNLSIMEQLELGIGDRIEVYKANMIIPQIADNRTRSSLIDVPEACPVCGEATSVMQENGVKTLHCGNPDCSAKQIKRFTHFVSRSAMNIEGLSEATIEKFISKGFLKEFSDLFHLDVHKEAIEDLEGYGKRSYANLLQAVEKARLTSPANLLYALGVGGIGLSNAKLILKEFGDDFKRMMDASKEELVNVDGIGEVLADSLIEYFKDGGNRERVLTLLEEVTLVRREVKDEQVLEGKVFVITGSLNHFENRNQLKDGIEAMGGKVTGSVTSKTDYLVNNDAGSGSSKNKKAKELGVEVITEETLLEMYPSLNASEQQGGGSD